MGREPRAEFAGATYHITCRGNNKRLIYLDDRDREVFLWHFRSSILRFGWRCHTYVLMNNHYHAIIETPEPNLAVGMCRLNGTYARLFNNRYGRRDHLFGGRYRPTLIETDEHFLEACRYVVLNPVRAELCEAPEEWRWSSFHVLAGLEPVPHWLEVAQLLGHFARARAVARDRYVQFVTRGSRHASLSGLLAA